jgi:hypothetical protein
MSKSRLRAEVENPRLGLCRRAQILGILGMIALGCGEGGLIYDSQPGDPTHPVKGRVLLADGKPAEGGRVIFNPVKGPGLQARGEIGSDGTFTLMSRTEGDGAISGEYSVLVVIPPTRQELRRYEKYANEDRPLLKASITSGPNELAPFQLK